jgi:SAM-dependent methyltransferase
MDVTQRIVQAGYDTLGAKYREWSGRSAVRIRFIRVLFARLRDGGRLLDLGCGPGEPATRLLAQHHFVVGVDISMVQLRLARQAVPTAQLVQADLAQLAVMPQSVDAVTSFMSQGICRRMSRQSCTPASRRGYGQADGFLTSAPIGVARGIEEDWLGVPMFFDGMGAEATLKAITAAGMVIDIVECVAEDEGDGKVVEFLWVLAQRPVR